MKKQRVFISSIQVSVFKDRIVISNPGKLPPELSIEDLKKPHSSYPANPLLTNCHFLTGDIEMTFPDKPTSKNQKYRLELIL